MVGKIHRIPVQDVWPHEAVDFTPWLQDNIDDLNDALQISLTNAQREQAAGPFNVDLVAEDDEGRRVIIENQLSRSDHDHLGKVITYLTALEAKVAVWITTVPRPEHVRAISWLNETSSAAFYLVRLEAIKIGDSPPAALFTLITGPSEESRSAGARKRVMDQKQQEGQQLRRRFWAALLEHAKTKTNLHAGRSPSGYSYIDSGAGLPKGLSLIYRARQDDCAVELYIYAGPGNDDYNRNVLKALKEHRAKIEESFGESLHWHDAEGTQRCTVQSGAIAGGLLDEAAWPETHAKVVDKMIDFDKAIRPYLKSAVKAARSE